MEEVVRWLATLTGISAAIIVAANFGRKLTGIGFIVFTVSSIAWIIAGYFEDLPSLMVQNVVLTAINLLGIYRWLILKERQPQ
ncbi:MAG: hypothetical protein IPM60_06810 [Rhodospirillales bacterium]|nr:hypothetical protein [Rhodospirillales bacterium]